MQISRIRELLNYDPSTGIVTTKKNRVLLPDNNGQVVVFDSIDKKSIKSKLDKLAYSLAFGVVPDTSNKRILHKNMKQEDNRLTNLQLVSRTIFLEVKEAYRNMTGGIRMVPHPVDQFSYIVHWFEKGVEKSKILADLVSARQFMLKKQLKYSKKLTKYCIFE